jgi:hypothetical protein
MALTPMFGTGQVDGWFSFHTVDADALQAVLPRGMRLHPHALTAEGTHPITLLANQQIGVRLSILPKFLGFPKNPRGHRRHQFRAGRRP